MQQSLKINSLIVWIVLLIFGLLAFTAVTRAETRGNQPQRVIVVLEEGAGHERAQAAIEDRGGQILQELGLINGFSVSLPDRAAVQRVENLEAVNYIENDVTVYAIHHRDNHRGGPGNGGDDEDDKDQDEPIGPSQEIDWGVARIGAPNTWTNTTGEGVRVSVIDTGVSLNHPDLRVARGADCTRGPNCDRGGNKGDDDNGHGTHVAGTIAALDNEVGVVGVAHNTQLLSAKALSSNGSGYLSDIIAGIEWSIQNDADVINMSLGTESYTTAMEDAVYAAHQSGVVLVAAAGNNGPTGAYSYPAAYTQVIAVGATNENDQLASFSNARDYVEILAPGVNINSTWLNDGYRAIDGTSMASPHVAGVAALIIASGNYSNTEVREKLQQNAEDISLHARLVKAD